MWSMNEIIRKKKKIITSLKANNFVFHGAERSIPRKRFSDSIVENRPSAIIAEIKLESPSSGKLYNGDPLSLAREYIRAGVAAISVVTEPFFFGGDIRLLTEISAISPVPVLRKDFILDPVELEETKASGADAVLLIASIHSRQRLRELISRCSELGLEPLVEVHSLEELHKAITAGAKMIGINNRDLETLEIDLSISERLAPYVPEDVVLISESGIADISHIRRLNRSGIYSFLVGTSIITSSSPAKKISELLSPLKKLMNREGPLIKFCGLTNREDSLRAVETGCDMLGFVFCESKRRIDDISFLLKELPEEIPKIGIVTEYELLDWQKYVEQGIDCFQVHRVNRAKDLAEKKRVFTIPSFNSHKVDPEGLSSYIQNFPILHVDSSDAGGSGKCSSWGISRKIRERFWRSRLILAGGLNPQNVREAIQRVGPWAVDVSSGIESETGKKDLSRMRAFVREVRGTSDEISQY